MATGTKGALDTRVNAALVHLDAGEYDAAEVDILAAELILSTLPTLEKISFAGTVRTARDMLDMLRKRSGGWKVVKTGRRR